VRITFFYRQSIPAAFYIVSLGLLTMKADVRGTVDDLVPTEEFSVCGGTGGWGFGKNVYTMV
jgi:hypothetical protein